MIPKTRARVDLHGLWKRMEYLQPATIGVVVGMICKLGSLPQDRFSSTAQFR